MISKKRDGEISPYQATNLLEKKHSFKAMYILKTTELPGFKLGEGRNGPDQVRAYHDSPNEEFVLQFFLNPGTGLSNWLTAHKKGFWWLASFSQYLKPQSSLYGPDPETGLLISKQRMHELGDGRVVRTQTMRDCKQFQLFCISHRNTFVYKQNCINYKNTLLYRFGFHN